MDTFGRLPKELLSNLEYLFLLPTIDILANYPPFYLTVKCQYSEVRIRTSCCEFINQEVKNNLNNFINYLSDNKECHYVEYNEDNLFEIHVDCSGIVIYNKLTNIYLPIETKDQLLITLQKYRNYLDRETNH